MQYLRRVYGHVLDELPGIVIYDDMCHVKMHLLKVQRETTDEHTKKFVSNLLMRFLVVDFFHFDKNHIGKWCRENTNPHSVPDLCIPENRVNTEIQEQMFRTKNRYKFSLRHMNEVRFNIFLLLLVDMNHQRHKNPPTSSSRS